MHHASPVAILLFTRPSGHEALEKPLLRSAQSSARVWQTLEALTWAKMQATGLPAFRSYQLNTPVSVGSFGRQLRQAARAVLAKGYETVLCVGNDCPSLRIADLQTAARLAQSGTLPLGLDRRGGVYLLGVNRAMLTDEAAFEALPWQTSQLADALLAYTRKAAQATTLLTPSYRDWNISHDVRLTEAVGERTWLYALAQALRPTQVRTYATATAARPATSPGAFGLRGPPVRV